MKRLMVILTVLLGVTLLAAVLVGPAAYAQDGHGDDGEQGDDHAGEEYAPYRGAAVYAEFCQACHGPQGEALASGPAFPAIEYQPDTAREVIVNGLDSDPDDGAAMPPYGDALLTEQQIDDVLAYMATWGTGDTPPLPEPNVHVTGDIEDITYGDPHTGAVIYARSCYGCHGAEGAGRGEPQFPPFETEQVTIQAINAGAPDAYMPAFGATYGGPLSEEDLDDLMAYLATWELETGENVEEKTPDGTNVLVIVMGVVAILVVGGAYMSQVVSTET